ncbi:hypothetical protein [Nitrincola iocasae]|uniref:hypothetical protein n=1 Tax=Nitrincola iocasae TaxID=2614693 RepID=UPI00177E4F58|nr:hypothetical protein [Nitrincola iocasae]
MDSTKIKAAANKALIAAHPQYHAWSAQQQETFRATMDQAAEDRIDAVLLSDLLGIQCTAESAEEIWDELPLSEVNTLNWAKLLTSGIGDDLIMLNEYMAENTSLLGFETLYDYDYDDYLFQERANKEQSPDYQPCNYYALRFSRWARLIIGDQFHYATLYSLAGYLTDELEEKGSDFIQTLIPHEYVDGKNHGKPTKGGFLWNMEIKANGLEKHLDELKQRWYHYQQQRWLELSLAHCQQPPAIYFQHVDQHGEQYLNIIFNNETALKQVRWRHFLADCNRLKGDVAKVAELKVQELAKAEQWLQQTHQDILASFDPKVVKLRKKRKIVMVPGVLGGLLGEREGD